MGESLYPEAIRGLWFMVQDGEGMVDALSSLSIELYTFNLQGRFVRVVLRDGVRREHESGDYTFDGNFLITRGRSTETYRVNVEGPMRWLLEGKKGMVWLCRRALDEQDEELELPELDAEVVRELRILPIRVRFEPFTVQEQLRSWRILYDRDGKLETPLWLGSLSLDDDSPSSLWAGITTYVRGLDTRTWQRFVSDAFLSHHPDARGEALTELVVQFLDSGERETIKL